MKKYGKILLLYIFVVVFNLLFIPNNLDEIWNYGFSYAIRLGEVPYRDFNMVITPLFSMIMSIPLWISNHYGSYILFYSIFVTIEFVLLFQIIGKKTYLVLILSIIFFPILYPTYNSFFLFLLILILYCEKKEFPHKDFWIGFLIACSFLTKQSVGVFFILPTLLFYKKKKFAIKKRLIGFIIPVFSFCLYLLFTKSMGSFMNLCFLGLFDFTGNSHGFNISMMVFLIVLFISLFFIKRHRSEIEVYYLVLSYLLYAPLFDFLHLYYVLFSFSILLFLYSKEYNLKYELFFAVCFVAVLCMMGTTRDVLHYKKNKLSHFEYKNFSKEEVLYTNTIVNYIKKHDSIIYHDDSYFYRIVANQQIGSLDLLNHGNHGYQGSKELVRLIKENKDKIYLVHQDCGERISRKETQLDEHGYQYIINHAKKIGSINDYDIYSFA
ncbi:MAG: hypothetical protein IKF71_05020 [Bacilli bacterium]|nr:hypothetical protein [Bacilli bacterium]